VLFGTENKNSRQNYRSLRPKEIWPRDDIFLETPNQMAYLFASPVDKESGIIGDFGLSIYLGNKNEIKNHLRLCLQINNKIFNYIEIGMPFSMVYGYAMDLIAKYGLTNEITSTTDPTGKDIGHTIPTSYEKWNDDELQVFNKGEINWPEITDMISKKRIFVNPTEKTVYQKGMALTLEPRLTVKDNPEIPMASFHTIVIIHGDGTKELRTDFEEIFSVLGMDYMSEN
jgi:hypothetical protein